MLDVRQADEIKESDLIAVEDDDNTFSPRGKLSYNARQPTCAEFILRPLAPVEMSRSTSYLETNISTTIFVRY